MRRDGTNLSTPPSERRILAFCQPLHPARGNRLSSSSLPPKAGDGVETMMHNDLKRQPWAVQKFLVAGCASKLKQSALVGTRGSTPILIPSPRRSTRSHQDLHYISLPHQDGRSITRVLAEGNLRCSCPSSDLTRLCSFERTLDLVRLGCHCTLLCLFISAFATYQGTDVGCTFENLSGQGSGIGSSPGSVR